MVQRISLSCAYQQVNCFSERARRIQPQNSVKLSSVPFKEDFLRSIRPNLPQTHCHICGRRNKGQTSPSRTRGREGHESTTLHSRESMDIKKGAWYCEACSVNRYVPVTEVWISELSTAHVYYKSMKKILISYGTLHVKT